MTTLEKILVALTTTLVVAIIAFMVYIVVITSGAMPVPVEDCITTNAGHTMCQ